MDMTHIMGALAVTAVLGMAFSQTRGIGLLAVAFLTYLYPVPVVTVLTIAAALYYLRWRSR